MDSKYWAAKGTDEIAAAVVGKIDEYRKYLVTVGRMSLLQRSHNSYYQAKTFRGSLYRSGGQNEYLNIYINHFRNILQHLLVSTTGQRPDWKPLASNTDHKSMSQAVVGRGVLDYYDRSKNISAIIDRCLEDVLVYGESYISMDWDTTLGNPYAVDANNRIQMDGDIAIRSYNPLEVCYDVTDADVEGRKWIVCSELKNRFDLAAQYPQFEGKIKDSIIGQEEWRSIRLSDFLQFDTDLVPLRRFYHAKTASMPMGRYVEVIGDKTVAVDCPLPYEQIPVYPAFASRVKGTPFGHTVAFDLLPIQEAINKLYSIIITNQSTFGVQNIAARRGSGVTVSQLVGGLNLITYDGDEMPSPLNLLQTNPEIFKFIEMLENKMETISGVNSVVRGNPEASLKSGAALALVASQAIQFNSGLQKAYTSLLESVGTGIIRMLKQFASTNRIALISGKSNRSYLKEFSKDDLEGIDRVTVELGSAVSRTTAGKIQMADSLLQSGQIKTPDEYVQLVTTGRIEPLWEAQQAQIMLIRAENEKLSDGLPVMAIRTDNHAGHIQEHMVVLSSPESREDPVVVQNTLTHIDQHLALMRVTDPGLEMLNHQPPLPPPPMPPMPQMPISGRAPRPGLAPVMDTKNPILSNAQSVRMPNVPNNPLTGLHPNIPQTA